MKKFLLLTLLCLSCVASYAAQLTATLQSGDQLTPFYGDNSFVEAYEAAINGDIITLSTGKFNGVDTIVKSIKIIGSYAFDEKTSVATVFANRPTIKASDVFVEGVRFTDWVFIKTTDQLTFSRCFINGISDIKGESSIYHTNTRLVDSQVKSFNAMGYSDNLVLQNCCITSFGVLNEKDRLAYIENCQIQYWYYNGLNSYCQPYAIYNGCFLGCWSSYSSLSLYVNSPTELHDSLLFNLYYNRMTINTDNCTSSNNVIDSRYSNADGVMPALSFTPYNHNSMSYGPINHKSNPAIPVVISSEIDSKTDAEGNLHVKINAEVRD